MVCEMSQIRSFEKEVVDCAVKEFFTMSVVLRAGILYVFWTWFFIAWSEIFDKCGWNRNFDWNTVWINLSRIKNKWGSPAYWLKIHQEFFSGKWTILILRIINSEQNLLYMKVSEYRIDEVNNGTWTFHFEKRKTCAVGKKVIRKTFKCLMVDRFLVERLNILISIINIRIQYRDT